MTLYELTGTSDDNLSASLTSKLLFINGIRASVDSEGNIRSIRPRMAQLCCSDSTYCAVCGPESTALVMPPPVDMDGIGFVKRSLFFSLF